MIKNLTARTSKLKRNLTARASKFKNFSNSNLLYYDIAVSLVAACQLLLFPLLILYVSLPCMGVAAGMCIDETWLGSEGIRYQKMPFLIKFPNLGSWLVYHIALCNETLRNTVAVLTMIMDIESRGNSSTAQLFSRAFYVFGLKMPYLALCNVAFINVSMLHLQWVGKYTMALSHTRARYSVMLQIYGNVLYCCW